MTLLYFTLLYFTLLYFTLIHLYLTCLALPSLGPEEASSRLLQREAKVSAEVERACRALGEERDERVGGVAAVKVWYLLPTHLFTSKGQIAIQYNVKIADYLKQI